MSQNLANIVSFPGPKKANPAPIIDDPLAELLSEGHEEEALPSSETAPVMSFSPVSEPKDLSTRDLLTYMQTQISLLREAQKRMDYYVEEIEAYLPQK